LTITDIITAARYTKGYGHGATVGALRAVANRAAEDLRDYALAADLQRLHDASAELGIEAASECDVYDAGWGAGYAIALQTFNRKMTAEQIADCITTVTRNLALAA